MHETLQRNDTKTAKGNWAYAALVALLLLGLALRLWGLGGESASGDEVFTLTLLDAPDLGSFLERSFTYDPTARMVPGYGIVAYGWAQVFGPSMYSLRVLSILLSLGAMVLAFWLARQLCDHATALLATFFVAVSAPGVYYGQEVRFYALLGFLGVLSVALLVKALDSGGKRWWILYALANAAMLWVHAFAPLLYAVEGLWLLLFHRRPWKRLAAWALFHLALMACFALWLWLLRYNVEGETMLYYDRPAGWREVAAAVLVLAGTRFSNHSPAAYMPGGLSLGLPLGLLFVAGTAGYLAFVLVRGTQTERRAAFLLGAWLILPAMGLLVLTYTWKMVFFERYVFYSCYAAALLLAAALMRLPKPRIRAAAVTLCCAAFLYQAIAAPRPFRADYEAAAAAIAAEPGPVRVHALKPFNARAAFFAADLTEEREVEFWGFREICAGTADAAQQGDTVWVLFRRWERTADFEKAMGGAGLSAERRLFEGVPPLVGYRVTREAESRQKSGAATTL